MTSRVRIEIHDTQNAATAQGKYYKGLGFKIDIHVCKDVEWTPIVNPNNLPTGSITTSITITHTDKSDVWVLVASK